MEHTKNSLFLVKENSSNDDNPEFQSLNTESSDPKNLKDLKIFVHSEALAKKIYHIGIPSDLKGLALWSAKNFAVPDGTMIDVGSHLGLYSIAFRDAGAGAVYSFECNPTVYNALVNNTSLGTFRTESSIKTFPFALGDRDEAGSSGSLGFYNRTQDGNENGFHMYDHEKKYIMFHPDKPKNAKLKLDMVKFDSLFSSADALKAHAPKEQSGLATKEVKTPFRLPYKVNFVKVSVNGFEKQVFQGMETLLKHDSPTLMFCSMLIDPTSLNSDTSNSYSIRLFQEELKVLRKDLFAYLESLDYKIMKINSSGDCVSSAIQNHFIAKKK